MELAHVLQFFWIKSYMGRMYLLNKPTPCCTMPLTLSPRLASISEWNLTALSLSSLCLTYTLAGQTRLTAPDPGIISQQAWRHTNCTIFSHPTSRHRPTLSSTLICFSLPLSFFMPPTTATATISVTFPSLLRLPFIAVLARPPSSHLCFIIVAPLAVSPPHVSPSSLLPTETLLSLCLCVLFLITLKYLFQEACLLSFTTFLISSHSLISRPSNIASKQFPYLHFLFASPVMIYTPFLQFLFLLTCCLPEPPHCLPLSC